MDAPHRREDRSQRSQARSRIEILSRHETRLGRIERDLNEVKSDQVLLENRLLNQMNEIPGATRRIDELASKIDERLPPSEPAHPAP